MRVVHAAGLTLEPQRATHAVAMFEVLSDPAIYEYENAPPPSREWLRKRFERLESRCPPDGQAQWLNWVIRLPDAALAGYVQATVAPNGVAAIAYELASAYWGRGIAQNAVRASIGELVEHHGARMLTAVLKRRNERSRRLLERLGFSPTPDDRCVEHGIEADELMMHRAADVR
jgi:RimJ/RimL family protein N-acetyltransferase